MKCGKCEKELARDSIFCPNCGTAVNGISNSFKHEDSMMNCSKVWFMLGFMNGCDGSDRKDLEKIENKIKKHSEDLWKWYNEVLEYWKNLANVCNNEKDKTASGSE